MISLTIGVDLSREDFAKLIDIVAEANLAASFEDKQIQRIETTLDMALMAVENGPNEAQEATIKRYRETYNFAREPEMQADGTVTLTYIASDSAGFTVRCPMTIKPDGDYTVGRFTR